MTKKKTAVSTEYIALTSLANDKTGKRFNEGDIIDHVKFGPGIVEKVVDDKIEVIFRHEIKTLVHNK